MTLLEKFKKDHPNAPMRMYGGPDTCPYKLGYIEKGRCSDHKYNCADCWNEEYEGEDETIETVEESKDVNISDKIADVYHNIINRGLNVKEAHSIVLHLIDRGHFDK